MAAPVVLTLANLPPPAAPTTTTAIPTLSTIGLVLLSLLMANLAGLRLVRQKE